MDFTPGSLGQRLVDLELVDPGQMDLVWTEFGRSDSDLEDFISILLRKGLVTNFQLERVLTGERLGFFYGRYKVLYMIGAGTFARVYRAVHRDTGRVVAVKVLRRRHRDDPRQVEQFLREGRMGLQLRHPNIVSIYEIENDPRTPYLVMEFVEGETLREILKIRKNFDPVAALKIMADVCAALDFASQQGITHRDMKLSNVLVGSSGRCKLVDFGLAAMADTSTPEALADCPSARAIDYAALERGTGVRKDDPRSDIYFAGAILYHILSGVSPLTETRDRLARLNITRFHEVRPLISMVPDCPQSVLAIRTKAMEIDPEKRYQTPGQMLQDIQNTLRRLESGITEDQQLQLGEGMITIDPEQAKEGRGKSVMIVESKMDLQDLVRERLKSRGYRVLVYVDPERALERFVPDDNPPADCVLFSAPELGQSALEAFNQFGTNAHTKHLPAILLVDRKQQHIIRSALTGPKRILLAMPLKVRELRTALVKLLANHNEEVVNQ
jgi:eukaryotic-like serine/threonine-protein kinase